MSINRHVTPDLGGVWQYRQTEDAISSDEEGDGSVSSQGSQDNLNASAAEIDIGMFDPFSSTRKEHERWLKSALNECGDGKIMLYFVCVLSIREISMTYIIITWIHHVYYSC